MSDNPNRDLIDEAAGRLRLSVEMLIDFVRIPQPAEAGEALLARFQDELSNFMTQVRSAASSQASSSALMFQRINDERHEQHEIRITSLEDFRALTSGERRIALQQALDRVHTIDEKLTIHFDFVTNMVTEAMIQRLEFDQMRKRVEALEQCGDG